MAHYNDRDGYDSRSNRWSVPSGAFDDEELAISLSNSQSKRNLSSTIGGSGANNAVDPYSSHHPPPQPPSNSTSSSSSRPQAGKMPPTVPRPGGPSAMPDGGNGNGSGNGHSYSYGNGTSNSTNINSSKIRIDQRISAYEIIKTLGEGSFGKVKLAMHKGTKQQVALKIISRKRLVSTDMAGRIEREIEYLQLLRHPHIIKLYTVIKTENEIIMVLEYANGELFDHIVQHGKLSENEARRFFQQMLCAVEYCHRHKIVHRDLKPENLLLDENLNVKIADFGLSNIMTDGNFLKTSCGSPNYAAPEVISGKLYAGSEVDVWSCGVILYVLLVGRLPFDDDHIPSLFAKIARGAYVVPSWMSPGAAGLIKKMLVVNPVSRATISEIRQDPWFMTNLPDYLQLPVEPFFNTGIDPEKAIRPSDTAPNAPPKVQEKLHAEVTDKISKTMGYGKQDILEALEAEEPSAIKDAYMIVRENKLMQVNPALGGENPYFATSPPIAEPTMGGLSKMMDSTNVDGAGAGRPPGAPGATDPGASPLASMSSARSATSSTMMPGRPYSSKIGILPSSIPAYHKAYMENERAGFDASAAPPPPDPNAPSEQPPGPARTPAEHEETSRRLRPHSRNSQTSLADAARPQGMTPTNVVKRVKQVRWQFGIRSRNAPFEALLCIYKALKKLGCGWVVDREYARVHGDDRDERRRTGGDAGTPYVLPADPWHIQARWETGKLRSHSAVTDPKVATSFSGDRLAIRRATDDKEHQVVAMRLSIQIYEMESGVYLVDFKCAGYELPDGRVMEEKDVTSPFPFLDLAARLIMQLADAD